MNDAHAYGLCGAPQVLPRERLSAADIAFAREKRRTLRASWGAIARMLGRHENDIRAACEGRSQAPKPIALDPMPEAEDEEPCEVEDDAAPAQPPPAPRKPKVQVRRGSFDHAILVALSGRAFTRARLATHMHTDRGYLAGRLLYLSSRKLVSETGPQPAYARLTEAGEALLRTLQVDGPDAKR